MVVVLKSQQNSWKKYQYFQIFWSQGKWLRISKKRTVPLCSSSVVSNWSLCNMRRNPWQKCHFYICLQQCPRKQALRAAARLYWKLHIIPDLVSDTTNSKVEWFISQLFCIDLRCFESFILKSQACGCVSSGTWAITTSPERFRTTLATYKSAPCKFKLLSTIEVELPHSID